MLLYWNSTDHSILPNHSGKDRERVNAPCLEDVNTYGNKPAKFEKIIKKKKLKKIKLVPGTTKEPNTALSSIKMLTISDSTTLEN